MALNKVSYLSANKEVLECFKTCWRTFNTCTLLKKW